MITMPSQIELYEEISSLSASMVEAAKANDWDRLSVLEREISLLRESLMSGEESLLDSADVERKRALIHQILQDDAEIRQHTEPWMEHVRQYLGNQTRRRMVVNAYAAAAGDSNPGSPRA